MRQVADDVFVGEGTDVSWLVLREGSDLTLVDTGYPGDHERLASGLEAIGHRLGDVRAVLVTHAHVDHVGGVRPVWEASRAPVYVGAAEVPNAHGETREQASPRDVAVRSWRPSVAAWSLRIVRAGGLDHPVVPMAEPVPAGPLDVPGRPVAVACPGHTSGHTAFVVPSAGVLATGDALVTGHALLRHDGPQLLPSFFAHDPDGAERSLDALAATDAEIVVPGHGPVWRGDPADAVAVARAALG